MSRMVKIAIGLVVAIVAVILVAPMLIPAETYKAQIVSAVKANTGRDLTIGGDVSLSVFPRIAVAAEDVRLANAPWGNEPDFASMKEMRVALKILPLLTGNVEFAEFRLVEPKISLEVNRQGVPNWRFAPASPAPATPAPAAPVPANEAGGGETGRGGGIALADLRLPDVGIENGEASFRNAQTGAAYVLEAVNLSLSMPTLDSALAADGSVTWNGEPLDMDLAVARPRALTTGDESPIAAALSSGKVNLSFDGMARVMGKVAYGGKVDLDVPSVRALAAWAGSPLADGQGFGPLSISGTVKGTDTQSSFTDAAIDFDGMSATGELSVDTARARPRLKGKLALDSLDTNVYLAAAGPKDGGASGAPTGSPATPQATGAGAAGGGGAAGWSDAPIDLTGLKAVDADFALSVGEILYQKIRIGESALGLKLAGGVLTADLSRLALYKGSGTGKLTLNGAGAMPAVSADFSLTGLDANPFLTDAMDFKRLEGTAEMAVSVATSGGSQRAMVGALSGNGAVKFADGAIKGINLAELLRTVLAAAGGSGWETGGARDTDFSEFGGTFTIERGIVRNDDLKLLGPLVRLAGRGTVDLPDRTLNYRVEPKLAATLEGQGGARDVKGLEVPVIVDGPWAKPRFRPDLTAVIEDPKGAVDAVKGLRDTLKEGVKDGGAEQLLKGLFGRRAPAPEAAPETPAQ